METRSSLVIRPVETADFPRWQILWDGYNAFYGREGATALPAEITELTWQRFFDPNEPMHAMVAEVDGALAGLVHVIFHRSTTLSTYTCYLQDLFTAPGFRGRGVGRRLIEAVYEYARAKGAERVYWQTHETNATAMQLYDKVAEYSGFVVYRKVLG